MMFLRFCQQGLVNPLLCLFTRHFDKLLNSARPMVVVITPLILITKNYEWFVFSAAQTQYVRHLQIMPQNINLAQKIIIIIMILWRKTNPKEVHKRPD